MKLRKDIYSTFRPNFQYAKSGEKIKLVGVVTVENKYGVKFSVDAIDVIEDGEMINKEIPVIKKK